jgi:4'-phosphopantetheinyl transferase
MTTSRVDAPGGLTLSEGVVHVWLSPLRLAPAQLAALRATLDRKELVRAAGYPCREHRERFVAARGRLRSILSRYTCTPPERILFSYGNHGKPRLAESMNRGDLRFNLAHSADLAIYALARGREVGVDLEHIMGRPEIVLAAHVFSAAERATLAALPEVDRREAFYSCWTRKEAYLKARGDGLIASLAEFDVAFRPGEPARLLRVTGDPVEATRWTLKALQVGPEYAATLCVEGRGWSLECWCWP